MRVKQFVGLICSVIGMVVIGTTTFAGGNISDKTYYFRFNTPYNYTYTRDKMDTTSSYMRCYSTTRGGSYTAHVYSKQNNQRIDCSLGNYYRFSSGTTHYMINNVRERGWSNAGIDATPNVNYDFEANGVWSPDSV